jgi:hypothetical protein
MTFKTTIAVNVMRSELVHIFIVLEAHRSQNLESDIIRAIERETTRDIDTITPPCAMSTGNDVWAFDITATMLIILYHLF